ncbi:MAG: protein translocase subunit SecF, partial [Alphaproteobacteria bacterium]|nr:protein translocase subunit SecF [Alphaproteobacteria bacterium]
MKLHFMKYRKLSYWISGALILLSVLSLLFRGLNYGIDFSGGISMEVTPTTAEYTIDKMRSALAEFNPELQQVDGKAILLRVGLPKGSTDAEQNERVTQIKNILGDNVQYSQVQIVGPKIGGELVRGGILAILVSFVLMSIYIWIRYRGGYAVGSFVSLLLDFVLMFGFFSIAGLEFNQTAIAVILMGLGYSINDKVVNYDRIEENVKRYHKMPMSDLIDLSVNEMLRRTLMTSISTLLAMVGLYIFGSTMLQEFAIAMS